MPRDQDFASQYSEFAWTFSLDTIPSGVISAAKTNILDTLACAIAGFSAAGTGALAAQVCEWGGKAESTIWSNGRKVPAPHAAWVNGALAHARDYDDTHDEAVLHAGVSVVPAALAAAELDPDASGSDVLAGVILGLELACRLGVATRISLIESGFMYTALMGCFGATVAAARVLKLDAAQTANALGIALSQASGSIQPSRDSALTKRMQPGFSARTALVSTALAQRGISGAIRSLEGSGGLFPAYLRGCYDPCALRDGLGQHYTFTDLSYKLYPCCRNTHTAIDAALALRPQIGDVAGIRGISVGVNRQAYEAVCLPLAVKHRPTNVVQAQFSIPYCLATALIKGQVGLQDMTEEALADPDVQALAAKVETHIDDGIEARSSRAISPASLVVETTCGPHSILVETPRGHASNPMSPQDVSVKVDDCLHISGRRMPEAFAQGLRQCVHDLENATSIRGLLSQLSRLT